MKNAFLLIVLIVFFISCVEENTTDSISFGDCTEFNFSKYIDCIELVPLELNEASAFMSASQILVTDKYFFVFDYDSDKLLKFARNGMFCGKVGQRGRGPGEYAKITSVCLSGDTIFMSDHREETLLYSVNTNFYLGSDKYLNYNIIRHDGRFVGSSYTSRDNSGNNAKQVSLYDEKNNLKLQLYDPKVKSGYLVDPLYRLYQYDGHLFYFPPYDNSIYEIIGDSCKLHYAIDFVRPPYVPIDVTEKHAEDQTMINFWMNDDKYIHSFLPIETKTNFISCYWNGTTRYLGVYNKINRKGFHFKKSKVHDRDYVDFLYHVITCKGDTLVATTNLESLRNLDYYNTQDYISRFLEGNSDKSGEVDVLVLFKFK